MAEAAAHEMVIDLALVREKGAKYKPDSTTIDTATYDPITNLLIIDFKSGSSYLYYGVTLETWSEFMEAKSAGKFFAANIKTNPRFDKIKKDDDGKESV